MPASAANSAAITSGCGNDSARWSGPRAGARAQKSGDWLPSSASHKTTRPPSRAIEARGRSESITRVLARYFFADAAGFGAADAAGFFAAAPFTFAPAAFAAG